jgi:CubicO group peptidase (beta-lactamase class C family)
LNKIKILFCASILFLTAGCSQKKGDVKNLREQEKKQVYTIPKPGVISTEEWQRIKVQSEIFYDSMLDGSGFNGGMIVAKAGNIIFEKYKGFVNIDGKDSINSSTSLHIASVSKTFTAMAVLKLQELGKLNIEDSVTHFFPEFNYPGVTVKTLLNHRSGLPNYLYFMEDAGWNKDSIIENKDVLQWLISKKGIIKNIATPNKRFTYCNTNFALLALIIEKVSGKSYPAFMKENIFEPLGMKNTFVHFKGDNRIRSKSFDWRGREIPDNFLDDVYGDKNIYSTPRDLLKWDRALSDTVFLSAKSMELAYTPYSNEKPGIKNYGLGWRMNVYDDGKKIIFHNGWWHGNNAAFIRVLKDDATIILISNRYARAVYKAKNLVNIFGHYFDTESDDIENVIPAIIPESFPVQKKAMGK